MAAYVERAGRVKRLEILKRQLCSYFTCKTQERADFWEFFPCAAGVAADVEKGECVMRLTFYITFSSEMTFENLYRGKVWRRRRRCGERLNILKSRFCVSVYMMTR